MKRLWDVRKCEVAVQKVAMEPRAQAKVCQYCYVKIIGMSGSDSAVISRCLLGAGGERVEVLT